MVKERIEKLITDLAAGKTVLLDGAMGSELHRRGVKTSLPLWSASALYSSPEQVEAVHQDYCRAGASIITTNTFRTNVRVLQNNPDGHTSHSLTVRACELAHSAREKSGRSDVLIGGCIAPVEDCYEPENVPPNSELEDEHSALADSLAAGKVDFVFIETMNCVREAEIAARAAVKAGLHFGVCFVADHDGKLLSGEDFGTAVEAIRSLAPLFVGVNCVPPRKIDPSLEALKASAGDFPLAVYANGGGSPSDDEGWEFGEEGTEAQQYAEEALKWQSSGYQLIGGCCGTTPAYIEALRERLR